MTKHNIADLLAMPGIEDIEFEPPRLPDYPRPAELQLSKFMKIPLIG